MVSRCARKGLLSNVMDSVIQKTVISQARYYIWTLKSNMSTGISSEENQGYSNACEDAARKGDLIALKNAHENGVEWRSTIWCAIRHGSFECMKYAHENGAVFESSDICAAIQESRFDCFEYAYRNGTVYPDQLAICSILSGNLESVRRVLELNTPFDASHIEIVLRKGYLGMLKLLTSQIGKLPEDSFRHACICATPQMMKYLHEQGITPLPIYNPSHANNPNTRDQMEKNDELLCKWNLCSELIYRRHTAALKYVLENKICEFDDHACLAACLSGSLNILQWLRSIGAMWGSYHHKQHYRILIDARICFSWALNHGALWTGLDDVLDYNE